MLLLRRSRARIVVASIASTRARPFSKSAISSEFPTKTPSSTKWMTAAGIIGVTGLGYAWLTPDAQPQVPLLESPEALVFESGLSQEQVTRILSRNSYSFTNCKARGVSRYDGVQLPSNAPCEDRFIHGSLASPWDKTKAWMAWGVFDGHAGWQTADFLEKNLVPFVGRSLGQLQPAPSGTPMQAQQIQQAITQAFIDLDDLIIQTAEETASSNIPVADKLKRLLPAFSGSCALLSLLDPDTSTLYVACTGDSRAVLGQQRPDGTWEAIPLSVDQTGSNPDEITRINEEHPGEENIAKDGRILGVMVSRAFGDARWKWPLEVQREFKKRFYAPAPLTPKYNVLTPPYLTAKPVVTVTKIDPERPSFLIMATDGLWDTVSSQQAVALVGEWLASGTKSPSTEKTRKYKEQDTEHEPSGPFDFGHFWKGTTWKFTEKRTTVHDDNAAVHLLRNSLGGNHEELIAGRLALDTPFSRETRDDITIQVAFFNSPPP